MSHEATNPLGDQRSDGRDPVRSDADRATPGADHLWHTLRGHDILVLTGCLLLISVLSLRRIAPGICYSDGGDLQLASATLGVMHPPGYTGFVTLGYLVTRIPFVDAALLVTIACHLSLLVALALCMLVQMRLGVSAWVASALVLVLASSGRVWRNLTEPEIYAPSLAVLTGSAYLLLKYAQLGRRRDLLWSSFLFGFVLANRPVVIWVFPFFVVAWLIARRRWDRNWAVTMWSLLWCVLLAGASGVYHFAYLWARDHEHTPYNYIENRIEESGDLPAASAGPAAKWQRIVFHTVAREFDNYKRYDTQFAWKRLQWMQKALFLYQPIAFGLTMLVIAIGMLVLAQRSGPAACILGGLLVGNAAFLCTYDIVGLAGDMLPLFFAAAVAMGATASVVLPPGGSRRASAVAAVAAVVAASHWATEAMRRTDRPKVDAVPYLQQADMATFPPNAVILAQWNDSLPLRYAQRVLFRRPDIHVVVAAPANWYAIAARFPGRPVFTASDSRKLTGFEVSPFRNLWRADLRPAVDRTEAPAAP